MPQGELFHFEQSTHPSKQLVKHILHCFLSWLHNFYPAIVMFIILVASTVLESMAAQLSQVIAWRPEFPISEYSSVQLLHRIVACRLLLCSSVAHTGIGGSSRQGFSIRMQRMVSKTIENTYVTGELFHFKGSYTEYINGETKRTIIAVRLLKLCRIFPKTIMLDIFSFTNT